MAVRLQVSQQTYYQSVVLLLAPGPDTKITMTGRLEAPGRVGRDGRLTNQTPGLAAYADKEKRGGASCLCFPILHPRAGVSLGRVALFRTSQVLLTMAPMYPILS